MFSVGRIEWPIASSKMSKDKLTKLINSNKELVFFFVIFYDIPLLIKVVINLLAWILGYLQNR
jgi:hypothetical protein